MYSEPSILSHLAKEIFYLIFRRRSCWPYDFWCSWNKINEVKFFLGSLRVKIPSKKRYKIKEFNRGNCFWGFTFKTLVQAASSLEELIIVRPAVENPLKWTIVDELQMKQKKRKRILLNFPFNSTGFSLRIWAKPCNSRYFNRSTCWQ